MQFALVGDHADGVAMAQALVASGRHELIVCNGVSKARRGELPEAAPSVGDFEEVLANPQVDLVIVAGTLADRPAQLRRVLQSERHALCVYPPDQDPDITYEAALIQGDTKKVLLPLLSAALHPAIVRLRDWLRDREAFRLLHLERWDPPPSAERQRLPARLSFPEWDVLRALGGEVMELSAFAPSEDANDEDPVLLSGRFEKGGLLQVTCLPQQTESRWRLTVIGQRQLATITCIRGLAGQGQLILHEGDESHEEVWESWDPWPAMVEVFETALAGGPKVSTTPSWQDAVHGLELDDAARRSIERRRASFLEYPEASEEVGFKGTMTLVGCGVLWGILFLLILANWVPTAGLIIAPILVLFLALQLLRWVIPKKTE